MTILAPKMTRTLPFALVLLAGLALPAAAPAPPGPTVGGTVTITGTDGKDDFRVEINETGSSPEMIVEPAMTVTATSGSGTCSVQNDPQTGRPVRNHCFTSTITSLVVNLRGGDDAVLIDDDAGPVETMTLNAGPGNDIATVGVRGQRTLNGEPGDDQLRIFGPQNAPTATFNGGDGRDLAGFADMRATSVGGAPPISISGSLATNQVVLKRNELNGTVTNHRTDTLAAIERLEGTPLGDVLAGGSTPSELSGGEGPDNLAAGAGSTTMLAGPGLDDLAGGNAADTLDGGTGVDTYRGVSTGDAIQMRDGYQETVACRTSNTVVNDLTDSVTNSTGCSSVSTAAAKHSHDTTISQRRLRFSPEGKTAARVTCPAAKPEFCEGRLKLLLGRRALAGKTYRLPPGKAALLRFNLTRGETARVAGKKVDLVAEETDADNRPRKVVRRVQARRIQR
jgi:hypothetical protein